MLNSVGLQSEFFKILAHPRFVMLCASLMVILIFLGLGLDHFFTQALGIFSIGGLFAQAIEKTGAQKISSLIFAVSIALITYAITSQQAAKGILMIKEGETVESYQRGKAVPFHLGAPLKLSSLVEQGKYRYEWQYGLDQENFQKVQVSADQLHQHVQFQVDQWAMTYLKQETGDVVDLVLLRMHPRNDPNKILQVKMKVGERFSPDGIHMIEVKKILADRGVTESPYLGAATEIVQSWQDDQHRAWYYQNAPKLSEQLGHSPWVIEVESVLSSPILHFQVTEQRSNALLWFGLLLGLIAMLPLDLMKIKSRLIAG
jgi:hypothetical protein